MYFIIIIGHPWVHYVSRVIFAMSYFQDHGIENEETVRRYVNPDVSNFMSTNPEIVNLFTSLRNSQNESFLNEMFSQLTESPNHPASQNFIDSLAVIKSKSQCSICLDPINEGYKLPCNHEFHTTCILPWFKVNNTCPFCRKEYETSDFEHEQKRKKRIQEEFSKQYPDDEEPWDPFFG